jgi:four helix bundle protein
LCQAVSNLTALSLFSNENCRWSEELETEVWIDYSLDCKYIVEEAHRGIMNSYEEVKKMLISMINNPDKWC